MDSDQLNRWLTLAANVGVLIGILLLIFELNQNREMMRAQIRNDIAAQAVQRMDNLVADREIADILVRDQEGSELTPDEELRLRRLHVRRQRIHPAREENRDDVVSRRDGIYSFWLQSWRLGIQGRGRKLAGNNARSDA